MTGREESRQRSATALPFGHPEYPRRFLDCHTFRGQVSQLPPATLPVSVLGLLRRSWFPFRIGSSLIHAPARSLSRIKRRDGGFPRETSIGCGPVLKLDEPSHLEFSAPVLQGLERL